jgi:ligand-binding sensor domain-containing protein/serine phosphatase RsbU (regulator of sigma subunit)
LTKHIPINRLTWIILLCLALLGLPHPTLAQEPQLRFDYITVEDGLSNGTIFSMVQDQIGFMWFGTQSGLNKYDGYNITIFKHDPQNPNSLSNDNAGNLFIDRDGIIWIGTWGGGLNRLDPRTEQFTHYLHNPADPASLSSDRVQTIFEDQSGNLWIGTAGGGLNKFDRNTETFTAYAHNPAESNSLSNDRVWRIAESSDGTLWVATSDGLNKFNPRAETFTRYFHNPANPNSLTDNLVRTVFVDQMGLLWIGTETGLDLFDSTTETFTHFRHSSANPASLSDDIINTIYQDSESNIWIGTSRGGLNRFNRSTQSFTRYTNNPYNAKSLSHNDVRWILEDQSGMLWIATRGGGLNKAAPALSRFRYVGYNPNTPGLSLNNGDIRAIYEDDNYNLWVGTKGGGLNKYDPHTGTFSFYQHAPDTPNSLSENDIYAIHQDNQGILWLGLSGGGLNRFDPATGAVTRYQHNPNNPNSLSNNDINTIYEDASGNLWIGTKGGGLNEFGPTTGQFTRYSHNSADPTSLGSDDVYAMHQAENGALWISTYGGGLNLFDPATKQFTRYLYDAANPTSLSNNDVYTILPGDDDRLWIGTANGGLNLFTPDNNQFTRFTPTDGLPSQVIYGILADQYGNLWLSTGKGLAKFNPDTGQFISYDTSDGLENIGYNAGAYYHSRRGEMFFGGINGLVRFYPDKIKENTQPPPVVITGFSQPDKKLSHILSRQNDRPIELSFRDDVITFEFTALDYTNPSKNQYAYKMEGFDKDWVMAGNRRFATYTNLDPGSYTFWVKAANNTGIWNETGASIAIIITPPFWETWWFRVGGVALAGIFALTAYKLRVRNIKAQRERLRVQVIERTAELTQVNQNLQRVTDRLQQELTMAHQIEQDLLQMPRPDWPELDVFCYTTFAREVGGDFYVYHAFQAANKLSSVNSKYALAMGDASGKGMPAALVMAVSLASFQAAIDQELSPTQLLAHLDQAIIPYTHTSGQNCTFCYVELIPAPNDENWCINVVNAGCPYPLIRRRDGTVEWIEIGGFPLGIGLGAKEGYLQTDRILYPGDFIILTSDGVIEAMNSNRELFGFDRLAQSAANAPTASNAEAMVAHLKKQVDAFTGPVEAHDDLTIVVLQV